MYDLYDLGEFDQKGSTRTKWGTKEELLSLSKKSQELGIGLYWDAVLNHKAAADKKEKVKVVEVDSNGTQSLAFFGSGGCKTDRAQIATRRSRACKR